MLEPNTTPNTILLVRDGRIEESVASGIIHPGDLITLQTTGKVAVNSVANVLCERLFAIEDALQISAANIVSGIKSVDMAYEDGQPVRYVVAEPGMVIYARLKDGVSVAEGAKLTSNGDGTLQAAGGNPFIAIALEAKDTTDSEAGPEHIRVRIV